MPIYEYRCTNCNHVFEVFAKMSDPAPEACESCGAATLEKVLHPVAVHYKGSGFYSTDYGNKRKPAAAGEGSGGGDQGASSGARESGSSGGSGSDGGASAGTGGSSAPAPGSTSGD